LKYGDENEGDSTGCTKSHCYPARQAERSLGKYTKVEEQDRKLDKGNGDEVEYFAEPNWEFVSIDKEKPSKKHVHQRNRRGMTLDSMFHICSPKPNLSNCTPKAVKMASEATAAMIQ
jgi:hypothetical protein